MDAVERTQCVQRSTDRILTTHVGSLPRPTELDDALERLAEDEQAYATALERAVDDVVKKQVEVRSIDHRYHFGTHAQAQRREVAEYIFIGR